MDFIKKYKAVFIVLLVIFGGWLGYKYYAANQVVVDVPKLVKVNKGTISRVVSATGSLSAVDNVDVNSKITGRITNLYVKENDHVKAGTLLVKLDDYSLSATEEQARAKMVDAKLTYDRNKKLYEKGAIAKNVLDTAKADYIVASANHKQTVSNLEDTKIYAPIDGYIIGELTPVGETVSSGISTPQVLMSIANLDNMQIKTLVDESDIGAVRKGQKVEFTVNAYPEEKFEGIVSLISKQAVTSNNVIYYTVYVDVKNKDGKLFPSMTAETEIIVNKKDNVLYVPETAIKEVDGKDVVYLYDTAKNTKKAVNVKKGIEGDYDIEILGNVKEGDEIIANPKTKTSNSNQNALKPRPGGIF